MSERAYINVNGMFGDFLENGNGYRSLEELLDGMDRVGVWQTVAEYPAGAGVGYANRAFDELLESTSADKTRIIPAFMASAMMSIQPGVMDELCGYLTKYRPSCVVLKPQKHRYRMREIERVLARIAYLKPVILIDASQLDLSVDSTDLIELANRFPEISFIIRKVMWAEFGAVYDMMLRTKNIYTDNSWAVVRDAQEILLRDAGQSRLVFGIGNKANGGASIASIEYMQASEEEKNRVAYDNFASLFADGESRKKLASNKKIIGNKVRNSFWNEYLRGKGLHGVEIIDAHTHIGVWGGGYYIRESRIEEQFRQFEREMELFGISKIVSTESAFGTALLGNYELEKGAAGREDRFRGYLKYDPNLSERYTKEYLDERFAGKYFVGLKTLPTYSATPIGSEKYTPMFRYADEHRLPILIHTWEGACGSALACAEAASKWKNATVILGHSGGGNEGRRQCERIANDHKYDNCMFEFCGSFTSDICWEDTLKKIDYHRVLYGTDSFLHSIPWELGRLLSTDIPDEQLVSILGGNAKRLFGF